MENQSPECEDPKHPKNKPSTLNPKPKAKPGVVPDLVPTEKNLKP